MAEDIGKDVLKGINTAYNGAKKIFSSLNPFD